MGKKISNTLKTQTLQDLANLLTGGTSLHTALLILSKQTKHEGLKNRLFKLHEHTKSGNSLSSVLHQYKELFSPVVAQLIRTAEKSGTLPETLDHIVKLFSE